MMNSTQQAENNAQGLNLKIRIMQTGLRTALSSGQTLERVMKRAIFVACALALAPCAWTSSAHAASTANIVCYLWADQPTSASYTPSTSYSFNKPGGQNKVTRSGP